MHRIVTAIRRSIRAALRTAQALVAAVRGYRFRLIADLYRAIDAGRAVRIGYRKQDGTESERVIEPAELRATDTGDITVRAFDQLRGEDRTFRIDRIVNYRAA